MATKARKPSLVTSMVYVPGVTVEIVYSPTLLVSAVRVSFVCVSVALTVAPTTAPPVASLTLPTREPKTTWALAGGYETARVRAIVNTAHNGSRP